MEKLQSRLKTSLKELRAYGIQKADIGIIAGTGLSGISPVSDINISYNNVSGLKKSHTSGHMGEILYGSVDRKNILFFSGRSHFYEGYSMKDIMYPVDLTAALGAKIIIIISAAGGLNQSFKNGDIMLIKDHINMMGINPLRGLQSYYNENDLFCDMSSPYSKELNEKFARTAKEFNANIKSGVYAAVSGPSIETAAETRLLMQTADAVGMSTVPEVIAANRNGVETMAIAVISNVHNPDNFKPVRIKQIIRNCKISAEILKPQILQFTADLVITNKKTGGNSTKIASGDNI